MSFSGKFDRRRGWLKVPLLIGAIAVFAVVLLAGCGGSDDTTGGSEDTAAETEEATSEEASEEGVIEQRVLRTALVDGAPRCDVDHRGRDAFDHRRERRHGCVADLRRQRRGCRRLQQQGCCQRCQCRR